jgi:hypothetical protein
MVNGEWNREARKQKGRSVRCAVSVTRLSSAVTHYRRGKLFGVFFSHDARSLKRAL